MKKQTLIDAIKNTPTFVATFRVTKTVKVIDNDNGRWILLKKNLIVDATSYSDSYRYYDKLHGVMRFPEIPASYIEFHGYRPV